MKKGLLVCIVIAIIVGALLLFASCDNEPVPSTVVDGGVTTPAPPDIDGTPSIQDGAVDDEEEKDADAGTDGDATTPEAEEDPQEGSAEDGTEEAGETPEDTQNASDDTETTQTDTEDPTVDTPTDGDDTQTDGEPTDDGTPEPTEDDLDTLLETDPEAYYRALETRGEIRILDTAPFDPTDYRDGTFAYANTRSIQGEYDIYVGANRVGTLTIGGQGNAFLETEKGVLSIALRGGYNVQTEYIEIEGSESGLFITRDTETEMRLTFVIVLGADEYPLTFTAGMDVWIIEAAAQDVLRSVEALVIPQDEEENTPTGESSAQDDEEPQGTGEEPGAEEQQDTEKPVSEGSETVTGDTDTPSEPHGEENVKPSDNTEETQNEETPSDPPAEDPTEPTSGGNGSSGADDPKDPEEVVIGVPEESDCRDFLLSFGGKCALVETTSYHIDATYENYTVALFDMTRQEYKDMTRRLNRLENPEYADEDSMPTTLVVTGKVGAKHYSFTMHDGGETNGAYGCIIDINGFPEG